MILKLIQGNRLKLKNLLKFTFFLILITSIGFISNKWVLDINNYFYADDWGWFLYSKQHNFLSYLRILPLQMYNDRPVGQIFLKLLYYIFGFNYITQHILLLLIHIFNGILIFFLAYSLPVFRKNRVSSLIAAFIFVGWQTANFAVQWNAAIFDLLSIFFVITFLIATILYINTEKFIFLLLSCIAYLFALRTKESNLFFPFVTLFLSIFIYKKPFIWLKKLIPQLIIWLTYTTVLIYLAVTTNLQGLNEIAAYQSSFSPLIFVRNIFRYIILYFDITNVYQTYQRNIWLTITIGIFSFLYIYFLCTKKRKDIPIVLFFIISIILSLLPVLPLLYSQVRLYLYVSSIFFSLLLTFITFQFSKNNYLNLVFWIAVIVYINLFNSGTIETRKQWLRMGYENRIVFENTKKLIIPNKVKKIEIIHMKEPTALFQFGKGDVLRLILSNNNIDIYINPNNTQKDKESYVIDYYKIKPIKE